MGKKLIVKGADFSENGIKEVLVTLDKSELYNYQGELVTPENFAQQGQTNAYYCYNRTSDNKIVWGSNLLQKIFSSRIEVEDYEFIDVTFVSAPGSTVGTLGYQISVAFTDADNNTIKAYTSSLEAEGDLYEKIPANFSGVIPIPQGSVYLFVTDYFRNDGSTFNLHKLMLKKYSIED